MRRPRLREGYTLAQGPSQQEGGPLPGPSPALVSNQSEWGGPAFRDRTSGPSCLAPVISSASNLSFLCCNHLRRLGCSQIWGAAHSHPPMKSSRGACQACGT